jgi:hypothetical protein
MKSKRDQLLSVSPSQHRAIDVLLRGGTQEDAALESGVTRITISRWRNHHPGFQAEFNARLAALREERAHMIREMVCDALDELARQVREGDADAARFVVRHFGVDAITKVAVGPTDPDELLNRRAAARIPGPYDALINADNPTAGEVARARADLEQELLDELYSGADEGND